MSLALGIRENLPLHPNQLTGLAATCIPPPYLCISLGRTSHEEREVTQSCRAAVTLHTDPGFGEVATSVDGKGGGMV
jgi:hypothetical protein